MSSPSLVRMASLVFAAVTVIVIGDTAGKILTASNVPPVFIAWSRFAISALVFIPFSGLRINELRHLLNWRVLLRSVLIVCGIMSILTALKSEPIANVFGAFFVGPMVSYALAVFFLKEKLLLKRALLLAAGFIGVLLVIKPGFGASTGMAFALLAGTCHGAYLVMTRRIAGEFRPRFLLVSQLIIGSAILTPFGLSAMPSSLEATTSALLVLSALTSTAGNYLLIVAHRKYEAGSIAPLIYSQLISATLIGIWVFGEWPDTLALAGLSITAISGLASLRLVKTQAVPVSSANTA